MRYHLSSLLPQQAVVLGELTRLITYGQLSLNKDFAAPQAVTNALARRYRRANE